MTTKELETDVDEFDEVPVERQIKDPVHGLMTFSDRVCLFIDTPQFQRLRSIKQLGTSYYVWPGAAHNRFEHCLGVAHLARTMTQHLQKGQSRLKITDRDIECVTIAGLCHDLGHGPWSHVFDGHFMPRVGCDWTHEEGSVLMFDDLVNEKGIELADADARFIKALILGNPNLCASSEKGFLFEIVANKRNGLDVDKFDYISRDSRMIGQQIEINTTKIIQSARVMNNEITYDIKDINQIYEICASRFRLHKMVYNHKTAKAMEHMVVDSLVLANNALEISESIKNPRKFIFLTDDRLMGKIEESEGDDLAEARAIWKRIRNRDMYKQIEYCVIDFATKKAFGNFVTPQAIVNAAKEYYAALPSIPHEMPSVEEVIGLKETDVIVDLSTLHYGMKEKNPLNSIRFYSKQKSEMCKIADPTVYSTLLPQCFAEVLVQIFVKRPKFHGLMYQGYLKVIEQYNNSDDQDIPQTFPPAFTPPLTEPSSTPGPLGEAFEMTTPPRTLGTFGKEDSSESIPQTKVKGKRSLEKTRSHTGNDFMSVPPDFNPNSPKRKGKRPRDDEEADHSPPRKKLS